VFYVPTDGSCFVPVNRSADRTSISYHCVFTLAIEKSTLSVES